MTQKIRWTPFIAGLGAIVLLSGCAGADDPQPADEPAATTQAPTTETTTGGDDPTTAGTTTPQGGADDRTPGGDQSPATGSPVGGDVAVGLAAVAQAESEVPGSRAIGLDLDRDGTWKVDLIEGDTKHELRFSADGSQVTEREEEPADRSDVMRAGQIQVALPDAVQTAMAEVDGTFDDVELDDHNDTAAWEVEIDAATGDDVTIYVDVVSGEIIGRE